MKVLVDMNLSPLWVAYLADHGIDALHWSSVGDPRAEDAVIMGRAREHGYTGRLDSGGGFAEKTKW